ncbi:MAG: type II secretion system protein, partial [Candidatus Taylorbacteria bacterium]
MPRTSSHHSNKPSSSLSSSRAFTLIELLVVIAIIG